MYLQSDHFLLNKYHTWYSNIISKAQARGIKSRIDALERFNLKVERHHIIPRALGGTNDEANLVFVTLKEHFVCHWLLTKMTENTLRAKMLYALNGMKRVSKNHTDRYSNKTTARVYEYIKPLIVKQHSEFMRGKEPPNKGKKVTGQALENVREGTRNRRKLTTEENAARIAKMVEINTGSKRSENTKRKISESLTGIVRGPMSESERLKRSVALKGKSKPDGFGEKVAARMKEEFTRNNPNSRSDYKKICPHCGGVFGPGMFGRWHGDNCRSKIKND